MSALKVWGLVFVLVSSYACRPSDGGSNGGTEPGEEIPPDDELGTIALKGLTLTTDEDTPVSVQLKPELSDPDAGKAVLKVEQQPVHGSLEISGLKITYTPEADYHGPDAVKIVATVGEAKSAAATVKITVNAVNDAPSFTKGDDVIVLEDAAPVTVSAWATAINAGAPNESADPLVFTVTADAPALFQAGPAISSSGELSFTPTTDANGSATVTVTLSDGTAASSATSFLITVTAVNDTPAFTAGGDVTISEDAPAHTVASWSTAVSTGPPDESGQGVVYLVGNDNPSLFASAPTLSSAGTLTFTPQGNANGSAIVTVRIRDSGGIADGGVDTSAQQTFTITLTASNDVPSFIKGANQIVDEDAALSSVAGWATALSAGPGNESAQNLVFVVSNNNSSLFSTQPTVATDGTLRFQPSASLSGSATVTVSIKDDGGLANGGVDTSATQTFTITVNSVNDVPSFTKGADQNVNEDAALTTVAGWATSLNTGAGNEAGQNLVFIISNDNNSLFSTQPTVATNGTLSFRPAANLNGSATVSISIKDDGGVANGGVDTSATQTFTITVNPVNDVPSFTKGADQNVNEDAALATLAGWATALSAGPGNESSQTLVFVVSNNNSSLFSTQPTVATDGTLSFRPALNANGSATVTVSVRDDGDTLNGGVNTSAAQTFTITVAAVNDPPAFTKGGDQVVLEDTALTTVGGWATAMGAGPADETLQTLVFVVSNDNSTLFSTQPTVATNGTLNFQPAPNANGTATVTLSIKDNGDTVGGGSDTSAAQTFTITVTPVNDIPSFTKGIDQLVTEDSGLTTVSNWAAGLSAGPSNESAQTLVFIVTNNNNSLFANQPTVSSNGTLSFQPQADASGSAIVTLSVKDDGDTTNGGVHTSAAQSFTITVNSVNDAPVFTKGGDPDVNEESGLITLNGWATGIGKGAANESSQSIVFIVSNDNNTLFATQPTVAVNGTMRFQPAVNAFGTATVSLRLRDSGGSANGGIDTSAMQTFVITVNGINDAPNFVAGADQTVNEDGGPVSEINWATSISVGPASESAQTAAFVISNDNNGLFASQPTVSSTGTLSFTPAAHAYGSAIVSLHLQDSGGTTGGGIDVSSVRTFTITVNAVNDAPSFTKGADQTVGEDVVVSPVSGWATLIDAGAGEPLQLVSFVVTNDNNTLFATQPTVSASGELSFQPVADANGSAIVTVSLVDDGGTALGGVNTSALETFTITVTADNDTPSFTKGADEYVLASDPAVTRVGWATNISAGPTDESAQTVNFIVSTTNTGWFDLGQVPAISPAGTLTYTPAITAAGSSTVTVQIQDSLGATSAPQTFEIVFDGVNNEPTFVAGGNETVDEDDGPQVVAWATSVLAGPSNESVQLLTFVITNNSNPTLFAAAPTVDAAGVLRYTTAANVFGVATIDLELRDSGGTANGGDDTSPPASFTITVNSVNDAPVADLLTFNGLEDGTVSITLNGADVEDGASVTYEIVTPPAYGALTGTVPNLTYTADLDTFGDDTFTYLVRDLTLLPSASSPVTVAIAAVNDVPSFTAGGDQTPDEDSGLQTVFAWATGLSAGPANEVTQSLVFVVSNDAPGLFALQPTVATDGTLMFAAATNAVGSATVSVSIRDSGGTNDGGINQSAVQTFVITLNPVNDAPSFVLGGDEYGFEDAGAQSVSGFAGAIQAGGSDESGQVVSFLVSNDNNALFLVQPAIDAAGALTYTPAPDANGGATVTVIAQDDGGTMSGGDDTSDAQTFNLWIAPVNDAPTFTGSGDITIDEDTSYMAGITWVTGISTGPGDEFMQFYGFNVTVANSSLFAPGQQPYIDMLDGSLKFEPAFDANGSTVAYVTLFDDGGTANGGIDNSQQTLLITLTAVEDWPIGINDAAGLAANTQVDISVLVNDIEPDGQALMLTSVSPATSGTTSIVSPGVVRYIPTPGFTGQDSFAYNIEDSNGNPGGAMVYVFVGGDATAPTFIANQSNPLHGDLLNNDEAYGTGAQLSPARFVFDDPQVKADEVIVAVSVAGFALTPNVDFFQMGAAVSSVVEVNINPGRLMQLLPPEGAELRFELTNIKDVFANAGAGVTVDVWYDAYVSGPTFHESPQNESSRFIASWNEPMDVSKIAAFQLRNLTLDAAVAADPIAGKAFFDLGGSNNAFYFVPADLLQSGHMYSIQTTGFTDLAGNPADVWWTGPVCCTGGFTQPEIIDVQFVNRISGLVDHKLEVDDVKNGGAMIPASIRGQDHLLQIVFDQSLNTGNWDSELRKRSDFGDGASHSPVFVQTSSVNDTLQFDLEIAEPFSLWDASSQWHLRLRVQGLAMQNDFSSELALTVQAAGPDSATPSVIALGGMAASSLDGSIVRIRPEEPLVVAFSEAVDPATLHGGNFVILGDTQAYPVKLRRGNDLPVVNLRAADAGDRAIALPPGSYTLVIDNIRDIADPQNTLGTSVHAFEVGTASNVPSLLGAFPEGESNRSQNAPVRLFFTDAMSIASLGDVGPPLLQGVRLEERWETTWIPRKGLSGRRDASEFAPPQTVNLSMPMMGWRQNTEHRLTLLGGITNIDGAPLDTMSVGTEILFTTSDMASPVAPQIYSNFHFTDFSPNTLQMGGETAVSEMEFNIWGQDSGNAYWAAELSTLYQGGLTTSGQLPSPNWQTKLGGQALDNFLPPGTSDYLFASLIDSDGLEDRSVFGIHRLKTSTLVSAAPEMITSGTGRFRISGSITDAADAALIHTVGIIIASVNPATTPVELTGLAYRSLAQVSRDADGTLSFTHEMPLDVSLPTLTAGFEYRPIAQMSVPHFLSASGDSLEAISAMGTLLIPEAGANQAPSFVPGGNQTLQEDAGLQTVPGWATAMSAGPGTESTWQTTAFVVTNNQPALFAQQPTVASDGTLSFEAAPDAFGAVSVSVRLKDDGGTAGGGLDTSSVSLLTINILPVNDAPSFMPGANVTSFEDEPGQAQWTTVVDAGAANEGSQDLQFYVSTNNPALFSVPPYVEFDGKLAYVPAPDANGLANVSIYLQDSGGTSNGGTDTSAVAYFDISVLAVNDAPLLSLNSTFGVLESDPANFGLNGVDLVASSAAGPLDESWQSFNYAVTTATPWMFNMFNQPWIDTAGRLYFELTPDAFGTAVVFVHMSDNGGTMFGGQDTTMLPFAFAVTGVEDAPVANNDLRGTALDTPIDIEVTVNDYDPDFQPIYVFSAGSATQGTVTQLSGSTIRYTPNGGHTGHDAFMYELRDSTGNSAWATVTVYTGGDSIAPVFMAGASNPMNFDELNIDEAWGAGIGGIAQLSPAVFQFDDSMLDAIALQVDVILDGLPLSEGPDFMVNRGYSDKIQVMLNLNPAALAPGGNQLTFSLTNVKDMFDNYGDDVTVAVWYDGVAPNTMWYESVWGTGRVVAGFGEPMDVGTLPAFTYTNLTQGTPVLPYNVTGGLAPVAFFSLSTPNDAFYFVPGESRTPGDIYAVSVSGMTDLAGNPTMNDWMWGTACCNDADKPAVTAVQLVDRNSGVVMHTFPAGDVAAGGLLVPAAMGGSDHDLRFIFDRSLAPGGNSYLSPDNEMGGGFQVMAGYATVVTADDALVFSLFSAGAFWEPRNTYQAYVGATASGPMNAWINLSMRIAVQGGAGDVTAPTITAVAARAASDINGLTPRLRGEEPLMLAFSEKLDFTTLLPANFSIVPASGPAYAVVLGDDGRGVLRVRAANAQGDPIALPDGDYTLQVQGLKDLGNPQNQMSADAVTFEVRTAGITANFMTSGPQDGTVNVGTNGRMQLYFDDAMSRASFTDDGPLPGLQFADLWGTTWIPLRGIDAEDGNDSRLEPGEMVSLGLWNMNLQGGRTYRLTLGELKNIDQAPINAGSIGTAITFTTVDYSLPEPNGTPDLQEVRIDITDFPGSFLFMGQPVSSSLRVEARVNDWDANESFVFGLSNMFGAGVTEAVSQTSWSYEVTGSAYDAYVPPGGSAYLAVGVTDAAENAAVQIVGVSRLAPDTLVDAAPVVTANGYPGGFHFAGDITTSILDAARIRQVGIMVVLVDLSLGTPSAVGFAYETMAQIDRQSDGTLTFAHTMPSDSRLAPVPFPFAYIAIAQLESPFTLSEGRSTVVGISEASAPFNP